MSLLKLRTAQTPLADPTALLVGPVLDGLERRRARDERGGGVCTFRLVDGGVFSVDLNDNEIYGGAPPAPDCELVLRASTLVTLWRGAADASRGADDGGVEVYGEPDVLSALAGALSDGR